MKIAERIVMVLLLFCFVGGIAWIYFAVKYERQGVRDAVSRGEYEIPIVQTEHPNPEDWTELYPNTVDIFIGDTPVKASVADDMDERIRGLSDTPFLPDDVVKLFVFKSNGKHSIWMKDMQYSIDIIWATEDGKIIFIEEDVSPETFPDSFSPPEPSWYVVETNAGFVAENNIEIGDLIQLK